MHQQVLHPRPGAGEFLRSIRGCAGPYRIHDFLAQHSSRAREPYLGQLPGTRCACGDRRRARDRIEQNHQRGRILRRRHAARVCARRAGGAPHAIRRERYFADDDARLRGSRRYRRLHLARFARRA